MTHEMLALSLGLAAMFAAADIAHSAPKCDARDRVIALLADRHGETALMELFAADATSTWSLTITLPDGQMCLMASGSDYEAVTEALPTKGDPV